MEDSKSWITDNLIWDFMNDVEGDRLIAHIDLSNIEEKYKRYIRKIASQKSLPGGLNVTKVSKCSTNRRSYGDEPGAVQQKILSNVKHENADNNVGYTLMTLSSLSDLQTDESQRMSSCEKGSLQAGTPAVHSNSTEIKLEYSHYPLLKSILNSTPAVVGIKSEFSDDLILLTKENKGIPRTVEDNLVNADDINAAKHAYDINSVEHVDDVESIQHAESEKGGLQAGTPAVHSNSTEIKLEYPHYPLLKSILNIRPAVGGIKSEFSDDLILLTKENKGIPRTVEDNLVNADDINAAKHAYDINSVEHVDDVESIQHAESEKGGLQAGTPAVHSNSTEIKLEYSHYPLLKSILNITPAVDGIKSEFSDDLILLTKENKGIPRTVEDNLVYDINAAKHADDINSVEHVDDVESVEHVDDVESVEHVDDVESIEPFIDDVESIEHADLMNCTDTSVDENVDGESDLTQDDSIGDMEDEICAAQLSQSALSGSVDDSIVDKHSIYDEDFEQTASPVQILLVCNDSALQVTPADSQAGRGGCGSDEVLSKETEFVDVFGDCSIKWLTPGQDHLNLMSDSSDEESDLTFHSSHEPVTNSTTSNTGICEPPSARSPHHTQVDNVITSNEMPGNEKSISQLYTGTADEGGKTTDHSSQQTPVKHSLDHPDIASSDDEVVPTSNKKTSHRVLDSDSDSDNDSPEVPVRSTLKKRRKINIIDSDDSGDDSNIKVRQTGKSMKSRKLIDFDTDGEDDSGTSDPSGRKFKGNSYDPDDSSKPVTSDGDDDALSGGTSDDQGIGRVSPDRAHKGEDIDYEEVDQSAILSEEEAKRGRTGRKRKSLLLSRRLKEVKKNWKKRKSFEDKKPSSNHFSRIQKADDSDSSEEERIYSPVNSDHSDSQNISLVQTRLCDEEEDDDDSMRDFIDSQESEAGAQSLAAFLPVLRGRLLSLEEAFHHFIATLVNVSLDPDYLHPEAVEKIEHYESLIKPSLRKVEDAISSRLGVAFSSAWKKEYRDVLLSKPRMSLIGCDVDFSDCEACQRSGHPSSKECTFAGPVYDRETCTELLSDNDTSDSDSEDFLPERTIPRSVFKIGKSCARRSLCYHQLYHYKFNTLEKCRRKVNYMKEHRLYNDEKDILHMCMKDECWKVQMFSYLENILEIGDSYLNGIEPDFDF